MIYIFFLHEKMIVYTNVFLYEKVAFFYTNFFLHEIFDIFSIQYFSTRKNINFDTLCLINILRLDESF